MNIYLLDNAENPLDKTLEAALEAAEVSFDRLALPTSHGAVRELVKAREGGTVLLPALWQDLLCVKIVNEIEALDMPFVTVVVGPLPSTENLVSAFNSGLTAVLETPVESTRLDQILKRVQERFNGKVKQARLIHILQEREAMATNAMLAPQMVVRDQYLGHAFKQIIRGKGALCDGTVRVLLVSSSSSQERKLDELLSAIGMTVARASSIEEAEKCVKEAVCSVIVSDSILRDGDAPKLALMLRNTLSADIPRLIVWSSSPEKAPALLSPENHIDAVVIKPGPKAGVESILPTILTEVMRTIE